jgi:hypothetical protein
MHRSSWIKISLVVVGVLLLVGYLVMRQIDKGFQQLNEAKAARTTTAVVKDKNYVRFDDKNHSYIGDFGDPIEVAPYTEQWRIYYQIDNFDQVPEPRRSRLVKSEEERIKKYGHRFRTVSKEKFDSTQIGDKLEVLYRYIGDEKEIISIGDPAQAKN